MVVPSPSWPLKLLPQHLTPPPLVKAHVWSPEALIATTPAFFNDPIGAEVADHLLARARAGVAVRLIINQEQSHMADPFSSGEKACFRDDDELRARCLDINALRDRLVAGGVAFTDDEIDYNRAVSCDDPRYAFDERAIRAAVLLPRTHIDHRKLVAIDGHIAETNRPLDKHACGDRRA